MMRTSVAVLVLAVGLTSNAYAQSQPQGISLSNTTTSRIYPVVDTSGWTVTQYYTFSNKPTHWGDDFYAEDWARGCGQTKGKRVYAGISGRIVIARSQKGYGNTVIIYDETAGFALRVAHLSEILVMEGDPAIAGNTLLGTVGNTGVSITSSCGQDPGAHVHVALYKNVSNPNARPITSTSTSGSATTYAAPFAYATAVNVIKGDQNATVYVSQSGYKWPVTSFVFDSQGWNFDSSKRYFNPVTVQPQSTVNQIPAASFWPARNNALFNGDADPTVYIVEDGAKRGVPGDVFSCRGFQFRHVVQVPQSTVRSYQPSSNVPVLNSCFDESVQAIKDMRQRTSQDWRFDKELLGTYVATNMLTDPNWEWRQLTFRFRDGRFIRMIHITYRYDSSERYTEFWDPDLRAFTGWQRAW